MPQHDQVPLQGLVVSREDEAALFDALEKAFDYRGDVALTLLDGAVVSGYIFDRRLGRTPADSCLRLMSEGSSDKRTIHYDQIARLEFTGRDTAAGKSFETWLKNYAEKKRAGQKADIDCDPLE